MPKVVYIFVTYKFAEEIPDFRLAASIFTMCGRNFRYFLFVLQIVEVNLQRAGGYDQLTDGEAERGDQEQQGDSEDDDRCDPKADEAEKHRHDTAEQTGYSKNLHAPCQVQPFAKVGDLCRGHLRPVLDIFILEIPHQLRIRQKPVSVRQHNQRHSREQQRRSDQREFFHNAIILRLSGRK